MVPIVIGVVRKLYSVMVLTALVEPKTTAPKFAEDGESSVGNTPVADNKTVDGVYGVLLEIDTFAPDVAPSVVGENWIGSTHVAPAARVPLRLPPTRGHSLAGVEDVLIANPVLNDAPPKVSVLAEMFLMERLSVALVPVATSPSATLAGLNVSPLMPAPVKATYCGVFAALVFNVSEPAGMVPIEPGVSFTAITQDCVAGRLPGLGQVVVLSNE